MSRRGPIKLPPKKLDTQTNIPIHIASEIRETEQKTKKREKDFSIYLIYQSKQTGHGSLYLSDVSSASRKATTDSVQIKRIVNLCYSLPTCQYTMYPEIKYLNIPMYDSMDVNLIPVICTTYPFIAEGLKNGENVLVHCEKGRSRSVSIIIAFLMLHDPEWINSLKENPTENNYYSLLQYIARIKSDVEPNIGFELQLISFSDKWSEFQTKHCKQSQ